MPWFVLNHISAAPGKSIPQAQRAVDTFNRLNDTDLELFAPTIRQTRIKNGSEEIIEKPLIFHYVFLRADEAEAKRLCALPDNGFSFVVVRNSDQRHAVISDDEMEAFKLIAARYGNTLPFFNLDDIDLTEGDKIEIVDGEFAGLTGTYIPRPRSSSGNVVISADNGFASMVFDVKAKYVRILQFAPATKRQYDIIDAIIPKLKAAKAIIDKGQRLSQRQLSDLLLFTRRMENVRLDNHKIEAKLLALLIVAKRLLGIDEETLRPLLLRFARRRHAITNPKTLSLLRSLGLEQTDEE